MAEKEEFLKRLLNATSTKLSTTQMIGGILSGAGLISALSSKSVKYPDSQYGETLYKNFSERANKAEKELSADMAGYASRQTGEIGKGLEARGIKDIGVRKEAERLGETAFSQAYAKARTSLQQAKLKSISRVSSAVADYKMEIMKKKLENALLQYKDTLGLYGGIGSLGSTLLSIPGKKKPEIKTTGQFPEFKDPIKDMLKENNLITDFGIYNGGK